MKCLLFAVLAWCGVVCAPAEEYAFPGEREWISKFGDVVKGSFDSCKATSDTEGKDGKNQLIKPDGFF